MNKISLFLYLSEVFENIGAICAIGGFTCLFGGCIAWFFGVVEDEPTPRRIGSNVACISIVAIVVSALIPSKTTMYAIAASELGESVVTSREGKEMIDDTKQILRDYLKSLKKEKS